MRLIPKMLKMKMMKKILEKWNNAENIQYAGDIHWTRNEIRRKDIKMP